MKKIVSILIIAAMIIAVVPNVFVFNASASDVQEGLNATYYQTSVNGADEYGTGEAYKNIIGGGFGNLTVATGLTDCDYFDESIEQLLKVSKEYSEQTGLTTFGNDIPAQDGYIIHYTGSVTATTAGTYRFVVNVMDNGCYIKIGGNTAFECWSGSHWIDPIDPIDSNQTFTLEANTPTDIDIWYIEIDGAQNLDMQVRLETGDTSIKSFDDMGITFDLSSKSYRSIIKKYADSDNTLQNMQPGRGSGEQLADNEGMHKYSSTKLAAIKNLMTDIGTIVVPDYNTDSLRRGYELGMIADDFVIEYNGYVTPETTGDYKFGTSYIDKSLYVEIWDDENKFDYQTVYEFWAANSWNTSSTTYYNNAIHLEAGKSYRIHAVYMNVSNGGNGVISSISLNGADYSIDNSGLRFTTEPVYETSTTILAKKAELWKYTAGGTADAAGAQWNVNSDVYGAWENGRAPFGSNIGTSTWDANNALNARNYLFTVKEITLTQAEFDSLKNKALIGSAVYDDAVEIYINGTLVLSKDGWVSGYTAYKFADNLSDVMQVGTNTIAARAYSLDGGYEFDLTLFATDATYTDALVSKVTYVSTPDDYLAYVNKINALINSTGNTNYTDGLELILESNLDMEGKAWASITKWCGIFDGNNKTISNIVYTNNSETGNVGLIANVIGSPGNSRGTVKNLTLSNCSVTATELTAGTATGYVGGIAGLQDRGFVTNCIIDGCTITGNAYAGGVVGHAYWQSTQTDVCVNNCTVNNSTITASDKAAGIVATYSHADLNVANATVTDSKITAKATDIITTSPNGTDETARTIVKETVVATDTVCVSELEPGFYWQKRAGSTAGKMDVRIICVSTVEAEALRTSNEVEIVIGNGIDSKTITREPTAAYETINAQSGDYTDTYYAGDDAMIFGWIIRNVPVDYTTITAEFAA